MLELEEKQKYLDQTLSHIEIMKVNKNEDPNMPSSYQVLLGQYNDLLFRYNQSLEAKNQTSSQIMENY